MATASTQIDPKLLDILRCPVAVHYTDKGDDPGRLEQVRDYWLVSADSGYKYPIIDGIPKMLIEEGEKWKDTDIDDLPVPPPNDPIVGIAEEALSPEMQELVNKLNSRSTNARGEAVKQLREAAQVIRKEAGENASVAVNARADEIASGLDKAAAYLQGRVVSTPESSASRPPWGLLVFMFMLGLFVGIIIRSSNSSNG